jgi:hypothetical protein
LLVQWPHLERVARIFTREYLSPARVQSSAVLRVRICNACCWYQRASKERICSCSVMRTRDDKSKCNSCPTRPIAAREP